MNITDVGHLTSDADEGEDKMLKGAKREGKTVWEVAEFYIDAFNRDLFKLNILRPTILCRATDNITEQIELIKKLEKKGFTYVAGGNVYFNASKLSDYGRLAQLNLKAEKSTKARVEKDANKRNPHDFVLWFTKSKFQEQEMKWTSPWGEGYPGWHIECSAMSMKYLGEQFDIHCGGIDHIPVHHTNEIAQSEAATGKKPWVKYWLHNEFLVVGDNEKMTKSGDNFLTLSLIETKGYPALVYRYLCLGTHYRKPLMFSYEALDGARNSYRRLTDKILELKKEKTATKEEITKKEDKALTDKYLTVFTAQLNDDLNTPQALATMWEMLGDAKLSGKGKYKLLLQFDEVLGLGLKQVKEDKIPVEIIKLAEERELARKNKDWKKSDELREKIKLLGYVVGDTKEGYVVSKI
jgi:cysteinyl-tRNA synthetase